MSANVGQAPRKTVCATRLQQHIRYGPPCPPSPPSPLVENGAHGCAGRHRRRPQRPRAGFGLCLCHRLASRSRRRRLQGTALVANWVDTWPGTPFCGRVRALCVQFRVAEFTLLVTASASASPSCHGRVKSCRLHDPWPWLLLHGDPQAQKHKDATTRPPRPKQALCRRSPERRWASPDYCWLDWRLAVRWAVVDRLGKMAHYAASTRPSAATHHPLCQC